MKPSSVIKTTLKYLRLLTGGAVLGMLFGSAAAVALGFEPNDAANVTAGSATAFLLAKAHILTF